MPSGSPPVPPSLPPASPGSSAPQPPGPPTPPPADSYRRRRRPRSAFAGVLLIFIGIILLIHQVVPGVNLTYWIRHYWPVLIILWGVSKLIDRLQEREGAPRPALLTGGEFVLIAALVLVIAAVVFHEWLRGVLPRGMVDIAPFTQRYSQNQRADFGPVVAGSRITITNGDGDVTVHPSDDASLHVAADESARAGTQSDAMAVLKGLTIVADRTAGGYEIHAANGEGRDISVNLDIAVPANVSIVAKVQHGDLQISGIHGTVETSTGTGDVSVRDAGADVTADRGTGDTHIEAVEGAVHLTGHGAGDIEIANVRGSVSVEGNTFGDVTMRNVAKEVRYDSPRTRLSLASLPGELKLDPGDIEISHASGSVQINAHDQDFKATDLSGQFDLTAQRGDINVTYSTPPTAPINITADSGDVSLSLPARSNFTIFAVSKSGDVENDFGAAQTAEDEDERRIQATYGSGGPTIRIITNYGSIHLRKN